MNPNVLVTGGAGYVGSHVCKALRRAGLFPVVFDDLSTGHRDLVRFGPLVVDDVADADAVASALRTHRCAAVIHLAGSCYVGESVSHPERYYRNNLMGMNAVLSAMLATGVSRLVFASSCSIFGNGNGHATDEDAPVEPLSPYAASKWMAERMMRDHVLAHGGSAIALRFFNACGADAEADIGEDHDPEPHLIPRVLDVALGRQASVPIFGVDYPTHDGTCIRDYIHVADLADAHVRALGARIDGFAAFNLGSGQGFSVRDIIAAAERVTGRAIALTVAPRRPGDPAVIFADPARAQQFLGWQARHSDIESILQSAWRWHQRRHDAKREP